MALLKLKVKANTNPGPGDADDQRQGTYLDLRSGVDGGGDDYNHGQKRDDQSQGDHQFHGDRAVSRTPGAAKFLVAQAEFCP